MDHLFLLLLSSAGAYLGYRLLRAALRRSVEPGPVTRCATCEYNLTANTSGICPECGRPTAGNTIRGRYVRSWGLSAVGVILVLISLGGIWSNWYQPLNSEFWCRHAPTRALFWQTRTSWLTAGVAWQELNRRFHADELDLRQQQELTRRAYSEPPGRGTGSYVNYLSTSYLGHLAAQDQLDADMLKAFKGSMLGSGPTLIARNSTVAGHDIPLYTKFATSGQGGIWIYLYYEFRLDDDPTLVLKNRFYCGLASDCGLGADHLPPQPLGEHTLKARYRFHVYAGKERDFAGSRWLFMVERTATAKFTVLPALPEGFLCDRPDVADAIRSSAKIRLSYSASKGELRGSLNIGKPSIPVISRIIIEADGKRIQGETIWGTEDRIHDIYGFMPTCPDKVKIILEPDVESALRTTDVNAILAKPITFDAVPVARQP